MVSISKVNRIGNNLPNLNNINYLRQNVIVSSLRGNCSDYAKAIKEYASEAIKNPDMLKNLPQQQYSVNLFSKAGLNLFKIWLFNLIRIKSTEEKQLKKLVEEMKIRQKLANGEYDSEKTRNSGYIRYY